ncbi:MAG: SWIM zinc finger family protein, partial [Pseudomonadota bacterium]
MTLTHAQIEAVAPDQASLNAARKLLKSNKWPLLALDEKAQVIFGDCQGSGAAPYRVAVDLGDLVAKCTCPSRKFPCKHGLALMWWFADDAARFTSEATVPDWADDWLSRRRQRTSPTSAKKHPGARPKLAAAAADEAAQEIDEQQAERAAKS